MQGNTQNLPITLVNDTDEGWIDRFNSYSKEESLMFKTNVSKGWLNFGDPISPSKKKMFNNMKSGLGSSFSNRGAQTRMMKAVVYNKESMDELSQMEARIKKLNWDKAQAMKRISQLERR